MPTIGTVKETYLADAHQTVRDESQPSLANFSDDIETEDYGTLVAVVSKPTGGILNVCDEHFDSLGMPETLLEKLKEKQRNLENIDDSVKSHNKAAESIQLEDKYREYIKTDRPSNAISRLVERVENGETITLVCFEKKPKWCHRHILKDSIEDKIGN